MATPTTAEWRGTSDHNVTETAFDAVKCKLSAVTIGYFHDPFLRFFVEKPTRRIPLIHRGYYLRHVAITRCVELFLSQNATSAEVNIVSLGAGFDTLFFRLLEQRQFSGKISFAEVDCDAIVDAKTKLLNDDGVRAGLFPKDADNLSVGAPADGKVAWQCRVPSATYSLISCDLGDKERLDIALGASSVDRSLPTLVLAECVVSYLAPEKGTMLLRWVAGAFPSSSIALYDPISIQASEEADDKSADKKNKEGASAFGSTLQRYFAVKGCTLRACTTAEEKRRLSTLEPFDEFADWMLCNAHYAIYLADNCKDQDSNGLQWISRFVPRAQQHRYLVTATSVQQQASEVVVIRSFQDDDLSIVRSLFESTHLEFAKGSRAVRQFVANRLRGPGGDMFDVHQAFQISDSAGVVTSGFWVAEVGSDVVGCVGVKPLVTPSSDGDQQTAELCRLSVSPAVRRRGVASALVRTVEMFVASCGAFKEIRLETIGAMEGAQQLYRALGYIEQTDSEKQHSSFKLVRFQKTL
ncbi:leucine carboxyl methyltransferase 2-like [Phytophthora cinnamomi]|uniref:leucine carboxyl methyltransferase 2-like n=1 Tax=Phytophthora cinnamomi TaxID=4785 RepID=UPI003559C7D9|nr:leucine carboxyl methyltransferase 2-like [Phytophthora cinnamomi]